jgi:hypothetical protein
MSRTFRMGVVLSVYSNRMLCGFTEYRAFLNYMMRTHVPLWDVERARQETAKLIVKQHPEFRNAPPPPDKTDSGNASRFAKQVGKKMGMDEVVMEGAKRKFKVRTLSESIK